MSKALVAMAITYKPVQQMIDFLESHKNTYVPVVGGGIKQRDKLGDWAKSNCLTDDGYEGNISDRNQRLNEATVLHTLLHDILPKTDADWYGLCHYRRLFHDKTINMLDNIDCDIVVMEQMPLGVYGVPVNVKTQYQLCHYAEDLEVLHTMLYAHGLLDEDAWARWCSLNLLFAPCNIFIAKRDVFNEHVSQLLDVAVAIDSRIDVKGRDDYQQRASSFLCERADSYLLFKAMMHNKWKFGTCQIQEHKDWKPSDANDQRGGHTKSNISI